MAIPMLSAMSEKELRKVQAYCEKKLGKPEPKYKKRKTVLDQVAEKLGPEWKDPDLMLSLILSGN